MQRRNEREHNGRRYALIIFNFPCHYLLHYCLITCCLALFGVDEPLAIRAHDGAGKACLPARRIWEAELYKIWTLQQLHCSPMEDHVVTLQ